MRLPGHLFGNHSLQNSHYSRYSDLRFDADGHINGAIDHTGNRSFSYVNDAQGLILLRSELAGNSINRLQRYYYVDGKRVGDVGNDGPSNTDYVSAIANRNVDKKAYAHWKPVASADFDQNYQPITPSYPASTASSYTVRNGDTLQSIARTVWGDASLWYLLADANGLNANQALTSGQVLTVPNKVTNVHNNSSTFRPYHAGEAIGDTSPTLPTAPPPPQPKKKSGGCGGLGMILVAVITVAVAVISSNYQLIPQALTTALGQTGAAIASTAVSASLGNIAGQVAGNVLGVQSGFNFGSLATAALTAGITQCVLGSATGPTGLGNIIQAASNGLSILK